MRENVYQSYKKLKIRKYFPLLCFAFIILIFCIFLTRLFIKMDDGNFLGIVSAPNFTYSNWLRERYQTLSGRTAGEFLLAFFLRHNILWWKVLNATLIVYIVNFWYKLSRLYAGEFSKRTRQIFCCCGMFLMIVSCLNPSVFWYAGSFTYLWPFAGMILTVAPLVFYILSGKLNNKMLAVSFFSAFLGTAQEQAAACCTALYAVLIAIIIIKKLALKAQIFIPVISILVCDWFLFTSPGAQDRALMEAQSGFVRYSGMSIVQKLACGLSAFFANSYYLSSFLILLMIALLSAVLFYTVKKSPFVKRVLIGVNIFSASVCLVTNGVISAIKKTLPHVVFRNAFINGEFDFCFYMLFCLGCILTLIIILMSIYLIIINKQVGIPVGLCLAAGFGAALAMSFSPTIFSSGQRVFFITNMFVITACVIMMSAVPKTKLTVFLYHAAVVYAGATFVIDCFAFKLVELPLMG